ncbi:hypothetical protein [Nonomuraea sp. NPDC050691]|uniref:hypothetical protein n=1 Tax=Nonomuraea sp. NPDC050691 TaxID=3155661 RepID=UPI0033D60AE7
MRIHPVIGEGTKMDMGDALPGDEAGRLEEALATVVGDLDPELRSRYAFQVILVPGGGGPYVGLSDGKYWSGGTALWGGDEGSALLSVAEGLQECLMEVCRVVWPECPRHRFGLHARGSREGVVWACEGPRPHVVAPVGALPQPSRRLGGRS